MADAATATTTPQTAPATTQAPASPPAAPTSAVAPSQQPPSQPSLLDTAKKEEPVKEDPKQTAAEIKLTLPKDSMLQQAQVDKIAAFARERGLSQEVAQAMLETQATQVKEFADSHVKAWGERVAGWEKELKANKEFGGEKLKEFDQGVSEVIMKYGGDKMMALLKDSGYGKNPEVAQFLWNIHKAMRPDKIVAPGAPSAPGNQKDLAERLFPTSVKKA